MTRPCPASGRPGRPGAGLVGGPPAGSGAVVLAYHDVVDDDAQPLRYAVRRGCSAATSTWWRGPA